MNDQDNARLEISRMHPIYSKCCMVENVFDVAFTYHDEDGSECRETVLVEGDDIAQQEILDALIRYKQRLQSKLSDLETF